MTFLNDVAGVIVTGCSALFLALVVILVNDVTGVIVASHGSSALVVALVVTLLEDVAVIIVTIGSARVVTLVFIDDSSGVIVAFGRALVST